ncbi:coiled-coil domain-containing protein 9-like protein [Dinothrombium tinctorium]|uniref:Splicing factor YJU2 n=1 Tax=Dinothrombium tinctorium TaxID=1965070 RepID=A0A443R7K8_9ACAR|nr:coiled-coil domain-containing protein 9-like protein [Dinothrombium tinctorium]
MSERKVLNKYYPPDFDPTKIPRLRLPKNRQYTVRIMTPCNMRCNTCGDYISKAKKFNARKETVESESYLGLKIFRFYFKCPKCMAEITFKTDPKNCDYELEHGATRNFQALRLAEQQAEREAKEKQEEEKLNPMKLLENRTKASRREMEELEALEELKDMSQRQIFINHEDILEQKRQEEVSVLKKQEEEDEAFIKSIFHSKTQIAEESSSDEDVLPKSGIAFFKHNKGNATEMMTDMSEMTNKPESGMKRKLQQLVKVKKTDHQSSNQAHQLDDGRQVKKPVLLCSYSDSDSD